MFGKDCSRGEANLNNTTSLSSSCSEKCMYCKAQLKVNWDICHHGTIDKIQRAGKSHVSFC